MSAPGVAAAVAAAAAAAAASRVHDSRSLNRVQIIAQNLEPHGQQQATDSGYSKARSYRTPSTPGSARSYTSSSGAFGGVVFSSTGSGIATAGSNISNRAPSSVDSAAPVLACNDFKYSASSGTAAAADSYPGVPSPNTIRSSTAGDSNAAFRPSSRQQQLLHISTESCSPAAGSTVSTASERLAFRPSSR